MDSVDVPNAELSTKVLASNPSAYNGVLRQALVSQIAKQILSNGVSLTTRVPVQYRTYAMEYMAQVLREACNSCKEDVELD